jgi:hypothetical protein
MPKAEKGNVSLEFTCWWGYLSNCGENLVEPSRNYKFDLDERLEML